MYDNDSVDVSGSRLSIKTIVISYQNYLTLFITHNHRKYLLILALLPAFWGVQVHATGNSITNAATEAIVGFCKQV